MAVVQISRIQQRRGKKDSATGFPQLASGEIGWAIDTQELYIGNGSVSEGAPFVGNTQILTERVNILEFVGAYQYQRNSAIIQTGPTFNTPIKRTIQERLDDTVSVRSFGAKGNGVDDDTDAIQRAIDQLFLNDSTKGYVTNRYILYFPPGEYIISRELRIPPYTHLSGAGIDSSVIHLAGTGSNGALMRMVDGDSTPGNYTEFASMDHLKRPRHITVEDMTLQTASDDSTIILLDNTYSSFFTRIKLLGVFDNGGQPVDGPIVKQAGVWARSTSAIHRPENVQFYSCIFQQTGFGVYSNSDHDNLIFQNCKFYQLFDGLNLGGEDEGSVNTTVTGCHFDLIDRYGIWVKLGYGNISSNNKFLLVGNNNEGYDNPTYPIIRYDTENNQSLNDYFERNRVLKGTGNKPFYPLVKTSSIVFDNTGFRKNIQNTLSDSDEFIKFPLYTSTTYIVEYIIHKTTAGEATRSGTIHITANVDKGNHHIQDNFTYTGSASVENMRFSVSMEDYDRDGFWDTLVVRITNPIGNGIGTMNYSYRMLTR